MQNHDLTHIVWEKNLTSYSSGGAYLKSAQIIDGVKYYYKLSNYDDERGFVGFESVYEYLASKLGLALGFDVLDCEVLLATIRLNGREHTTFVQKTADFLPAGQSKIVFEKHYLAAREPGETRLAFLRRLGFGQQVGQMFVFDYLIYNRDRHCNNLEFIKNGDLALAPLFDNGVSFFAPLAGRQAEIERFDLLSNNITNNDFGTRYLQDNLETAGSITLSALPGNLQHLLFDAFDSEAAFPAWHRERCLELIERRYEHARDILDS
jgi:hypothetical protein